MTSIPQSAAIGGPGASPGPVPGEVPAPSGVYRRVDVEGSAAPPSSNTGVQNTKATIDWLAGTFPTDTTLEQALAFFAEPHEEPLEWQPTERGSMGYRRGVVRGHIKLFYDGNEDMGVHFVMSGQGCRQFEGEQLLLDEKGWSMWLASLLNASVSITRCDFAFDDIGDEGHLDMATIKTAIAEQRVVSRFKKAQLSGQVCLQEGASLSDVIHLGSLMSEMSVCIYDKAKEQIAKGRHLPKDAHWVRCELRAKKDRAHELVKAFLADGSAAVASVLYGYLDFKEASETDPNKSRWQTCAWWSEFLERCSKLRLVVQKAVRSVEKLRAWVGRQLAPTLATLFLADGGLERVLWMGEPPKQGAEANAWPWWRDVLLTGMNRLRPSQRALLAAEGVAL